MSSPLSQRATGKHVNYLAEGIARTFSNLWHPERNPNGIVNLGVASNSLVPELVEYVNANGLAMTMEDFDYDSMRGSDRLREEIVSLFKRKLGITIPLAPEHVTVHNGCTTCIELLAYVLADPGEGVMIPTPYYGGFDIDFPLRAGVNIVPVPSHSPDWQVTYDTLTQAYKSALDSRQVTRIRCLVVCNPNNPLGKIYTTEEMLVFARFAKDHDLHLIVDEIYALSVWGEQPFKSVMAMDEGIDWQNTTVLWGFSKDFNANGLRVGCIIAMNPLVLNGILKYVNFGAISSATDNLFRRLLADHAFVDRFLALNHQRLRHAYGTVTTYLDRHAIPYCPVSGSFMMWFDLRSVLPPADFIAAYKKVHDHGTMLIDPEMYAFYTLLQCGVYLAVGKAFACVELGWFRLAFAHRDELLKTAMARIDAAIDKLKTISDSWATGADREKLVAGLRLTILDA
ncbi:hypothetical protein RI367_008295 [Sorochytrium milnesiophthora]